VTRVGGSAEKIEILRWTSSKPDSSVLEWNMFVKKCRKRCIVRVNKIT
jgi:hypothetical protein